MAVVSSAGFHRSMRLGQANPIIQAERTLLTGSVDSVFD
jgi:hypothetical protein